MIDEDQFRSSYPSFLQSVEFCLLTQGTLNTLELQKFDAHLIGLHDGNVIYINIIRMVS
jgi:hypothetical protein